jgi:hypothetical protein
MEWYKAGMPDGAKYLTRCYDIDRIEHREVINSISKLLLEDTSYIFREFKEDTFEYIPPEPKYKEITPDEAVICLLNGETVDVRFCVDAYWTEYNLCNDKALKFSTYELIKTAMWRKKVQ